MQIVRDITIISEEVTNPVTLAEAKNYLRVDFSEDDDLIESLITSARVRLEQYAGIAMTERTLQVVAYVDELIELPYAPITNILSVEYFSANTWVEIEDGAYEVIGTTVRKVFTINYPGMEYRFTYNCGYDCVPSTLKTATLKLVSDLYEYRESSVEAGRPSANLTTAYELMKPFKRINIFL
jgi:uncharacterized phiE125 gp8 family phage protein